ncbi:MAG: FAD:protein FMN transferase [Myxococcota bacterium]
MRGAGWRAALLLGLGALPLSACAPEAGRVLAGETMGTTWRVTLLDAPSADWRAEIEGVLARVDARFSTWREDSELSRFNLARTTEWLPVSEETVRLVAEARDVSRRTAGAFDPSVAPLVGLWGFGAAGPQPLPPSAPALARARARVGLTALALREAPPALKKHAPELALDLSGIAKGHGVDAVAERLLALGAKRFLVEIGGELRCAGAGPHEGRWRIAIERPRPGPAALQRVLTLRDVALATSGSYRNFATVTGERRPHVLDPRTGEPIRHGLVSVSVLAARASLADAFATGLLVLGPERGPALAAREGLAALFVVEREGRLREEHSPAFAPYLPHPDEEPDR